MIVQDLAEKIVQSYRPKNWPAIMLKDDVAIVHTVLRLALIDVFESFAQVAETAFPTLPRDTANTPQVIAEMLRLHAKKLLTPQ